MFLNGGKGAQELDGFSTHDIARIFEIGPAADDDWHEFLFVVRSNKGARTASAVIQFRCQFEFPAPGDVAAPKLKKLVVDEERSIIKPE